MRSRTSVEVGAAAAAAAADGGSGLIDVNRFQSFVIYFNRSYCAGPRKGIKLPSYGRFTCSVFSCFINATIFPNKLGAHAL